MLTIVCHSLYYNDKEGIDLSEQFRYCPCERLVRKQYGDKSQESKFSRHTDTQLSY